ncbi:hypothetical protein LPB41_28505 [Thalassospira sp. MA62]|nr:hypothetical protein [Thalassospira sp. MA62]
MSQQAQKDVSTANTRKEAVRQAFNQEYLATQQAMSQAAERARAQVIDQRQTISDHAQGVKAGDIGPQPPLGGKAPPQASATTGTPQPNGTHHNSPGSTPPGTAQQPATGTSGIPQMQTNPQPVDGEQVMIEIANEIHKIITREVDARMQVLTTKVETALAAAFPPAPDPADDQKSAPKNAPPKNGK